MKDMFGKLVEEELLGRLKRESKEINDLHSLETYKPYKPSVEYVKAHQFGDPEHPYKFFPKSLSSKIKNSPELFKTGEEKLLYYTALGSTLDTFHGVDAFFEYKESRDATPVRVTFDVTMNSQKDSYKADVVLQIPSGGLDPSDAEYERLLEEHSEKIIEGILTKLEKRYTINKNKRDE